MEITNKTKLQELVDYCWEIFEKEEPFDPEKCPDLDKCQQELHKLETICMNYLLTETK